VRPFHEEGIHIPVVRADQFGLLVPVEINSLDTLQLQERQKRLLGLRLGDCIENFTHREIAEQLRVYRESATVALGELKKARIISVDRKQIRIIRRSRLERAARE
jgi:CRP-like cAMP-binding protein